MPRTLSPTTAGTALLALASLSCSSAAVDPFANPSPTTATSSLPSVSLTMIPSVGEHSFEWGPGHESPAIRPQLSWNVDFTAPEDVAELWVRVRLLREDGTACLLSASRVGRVARGNRYVVSGQQYEMPDLGPGWRSLCTDAFFTVKVDVNLIEGPPLPASAEPRVVQGFGFEHFYFFLRTGFLPGADGS